MKIRDVQAGFRIAMECMILVFSLRSVAEKCLAKSQKVYCVLRISESEKRDKSGEE